MRQSNLVNSEGRGALTQQIPQRATDKETQRQPLVSTCTCTHLHMHLHSCLHTCEYTQAKNIQNAYTLTVKFEKLDTRILMSSLPILK